MRHVTLDGVTLLTMKTAEEGAAGATVTVDTFTTTREILETAKQKYVTAITKHQGTERMAGMAEQSGSIGSKEACERREGQCAVQS